MSSRPQLVLDIAGVLVTNMSPGFWRELSVYADIPYESLVTRFKYDIRERLWSGSIGEGDFWRWLRTEFPSIDQNDAHDILQSSLRPLPAMEHLSDWCQVADIHLLSNHRTEWLVSTLIAARKYIKSATISSDVGFCKPDPRIYELAAAKLNAVGAVLFVDDQEKNLTPASNLGWGTLLADETGEWIGKVRPLIHHRV